MLEPTLETGATYEEDGDASVEDGSAEGGKAGNHAHTAGTSSGDF